MGLSRAAFCLSLVTACIAQYNKITMGPFDLIFRHLEECPEVGTGRIRFKIRLHRIARDQFAIDLNVTSAIRIDESVSVLMEAAKFSNGGWAEKYFVKEFPKLCSSAAYLVPQFSKDLSIAAGYPNGDKCPIQPKNYTVRNLELKPDIGNMIPMFVYGKYRGDMSVIKKGRVQGCMRMLVDMVPKRVINKNRRKGK